MKRRARNWLWRSSVGMLLLAVAFTSATASAAADRQPCWRAVVDDWSDGGINRPHSLRCYRSALHSLPSDIRTYTTAEDDIRRAILDEIRSMRRTGGDSTDATQAGDGGESNAASADSTPTRSLQGRGGASAGIPAATAPAATTSPPLRAIVATALALALVLAAAIGKYHLRRRTGDPAN